MNKFESSPNQNARHDTTGNTRADDPGEGQPTYRQKRPHAPQFGSDRRNPRDAEAHRTPSARHRGEADGLPQERRKAAQDRRQSISHKGVPNDHA
jgi:hypothetical protein